MFIFHAAVDFGWVRAPAWPGTLIYRYSFYELTVLRGQPQSGCAIGLSFSLIITYTYITVLCTSVCRHIYWYCMRISDHSF